MVASSSITFVERSGADAESVLRRLARRLHDASLSSTLLRSRDEPGLFLLVVDGDAALDTSDEAGARVWRFESADA